MIFRFCFVLGSIVLISVGVPALKPSFFSLKLKKLEAYLLLFYTVVQLLITISILILKLQMK